MKAPTLLALALCSITLGCRQFDSRPAVSVDHSDAARLDDDDDDDGQDEDIPLSEVPEVVRKAALAAVPGLVLDEAEKEVEDGELLYSLEGQAGGQRYCVEVSPTGKVLEVEHEDGDEDDD